MRKISDKQRPVHRLNLKKELKNKKDEIVKDILTSKQKAGDYKARGYNFEVLTKYNDYLYNLLIKNSRKLLNSFTIRDSQLKVWCYFTGLSNHKEDIWHNHIRTSTINSVVYLQTLKDHGIKFNMGGEPWYVEPKNFDMLIFPGFLNHLPITSNVQQRISLNLELKCRETATDIFGL